METFIDKVVSGEKKLYELHEYIKAWYENADETRPMHEYLGLTFEEYFKFVLDENYIEKAIKEKVDQRVDPNGEIRLASKFIDELNGRVIEPEEEDFLKRDN